MKRNGLVIIVLAAFGGCGGSSSSTTSDGGDLAPPADLAIAVDLAVPADLTVVADLTPPADLTPSPDLVALNCAGIFNCATNCPPAELMTCIPACVASGSMSAQGWFKPLQDCAGPNCYAGGSPPCAQPASANCTSCVLMNCKMQLDDCRSH